MKRLLTFFLILQLLCCPVWASSSTEAFFDYNRFWLWSFGSTVWPQWPLYDGMTDIAGITAGNSQNPVYDKPFRHSPSLSQFVSGAMALRSELLADEVTGQPSGIPNRAENIRYGLGAFNDGGGQERWYSFSVYLTPEWDTLFTSGGSPDPNGGIICQMHSLPDSGEAAHSPSIALEQRDNPGNTSWSILTNYEPVLIGGTGTVIRYPIDDWRDDIGKWTDWVFHIKYACDGTDSGGFVNVWKDGKQVLAVTGGNCHNDAGEHFFRWGIYKSWWGVSDPPPSPSMRTAIIHDNVRIGNSTRNYNWAAPKRMLARNHDTPWATAGISRSPMSQVSIFAGVPIKTYQWRAGELWSPE